MMLIRQAHSTITHCNANLVSQQARYATTDKLLFTPGPLSTSHSVKAAMQRDLGSREPEFINLIKSIRTDLLKLGGVHNMGYDSIIMQGSGTFSIESVVSSVVPHQGKLAFVNNGAYGKRIGDIARAHKIETVELKYPEGKLPNLEEIGKLLEKDKNITDFALVHCETSTGQINPIESVGNTVKSRNPKTRFIVDAMSSFGGVPINFPKANIDFLVSCSNKCVQGVPGFGFIIAKEKELEESQGRARTLSLNLYEQWKGLNMNGQFRFTPPTHSLLAFNRAIRELYEEGGIEGRSKRYGKNQQILKEAMQQMGFKEFLGPNDSPGHIITSFLYPDHPNWNFDEFYKKLYNKGFVIYPGKVINTNCFRIGSIGAIQPDDMLRLVKSIRDIKQEMGF